MPIEIVEYRPDWPREFAALAAELQRQLAERAIRIDHIGSTSVPGLAAKDIIDIQVTVAALDDATLAPLVAAGYREVPHLRDHRPPFSHGTGTAQGATTARGVAVAPDDDDAAEWSKRFFHPLQGTRAANIHVRVAGRANQRYALLFRDYLRAHPAASAAYAELKRHLAALAPDRASYSDVKDPICDLIMQAAEMWALAVGWRAGVARS